MNKTSHITGSAMALLLLALTLAAAACSGPAATQTAAKRQQAQVDLSSLKMSASDNFDLPGGSKCQVLADVAVTYPKAFKDSASTRRLQQLYIATVMGMPDSLDMAQAVKAYTDSIISDNRMSRSDSDLVLDDENTLRAVNQYVFAVNITLAFHQNDVLTFCKEESVNKNGHVAKTHRYYNFDLRNITVIGLDMLNDDELGHVTDLLKEKLREQNKVQTDDELNDLGYFNIDNLAPTRNFSFDENGITWSYLPQELSANAIEEPKITLTYEQLLPYAATGSVLLRFAK